jgi:membrane-bound metal-dependent hydrolase YbcI (DUF457 family)
MRGVTHTLLGAAVALPIAVSRDPAIAAGCLWLGMAGGGLPDWLDLRSDFRTQLRLRHRGASHGFLAMVVCAGLLYAGLVVLSRQQATLLGADLAATDESIVALVFAFTVGIASHLGADACTHGGIRPLLPVSGRRVWLLPGFLRSRYDGYLDTLFRILAIVTLAFGLVIFAGRWLALA